MRGATEYERLLATLQPRLAHVPLAALTDKDAEFLAGEAGADTELVGFAVVGARRGRETGLPDAIFYGWARQGIPTELSALLAQPSDVLRSALETAISEAVVPSALGDELDAVLDCLRALLADAAMPEGEWLRHALPGADEREAFLGLLREYERPVASFWRDLRDEKLLGGAAVDRLHLTMQLGLLTGNHIPLLERLAERPEISSPLDLAKLRLSDWVRLIGGEGDDRGVGAPKEVRGDTEQERVRTYAEAVARSVERAFPTAALAARINESVIPGKADVACFLANNPKFEIASMDLDAYVGRRGEAAFADIEHPEGLTDRLRTIQRLYLLTPSWEETSALLENGFDSAASIVRLEPEAFQDAYGPALGGAERARLIHDRAKRIVLCCSGASG